MVVENVKTFDGMSRGYFGWAGVGQPNNYTWKEWCRAMELDLPGHKMTELAMLAGHAAQYDQIIREAEEAAKDHEDAGDLLGGRRGIAEYEAEAGPEGSQDGGAGRKLEGRIGDYQGFPLAAEFVRRCERGIPESALPFVRALARGDKPTVAQVDSAVDALREVEKMEKGGNPQQAQQLAGDAGQVGGRGHRASQTVRFAEDELVTPVSVALSEAELSGSGLVEPLVGREPYSASMADAMIADPQWIRCCGGKTPILTGTLPTQWVVDLQRTPFSFRDLVTVAKARCQERVLVVLPTVRSLAPGLTAAAWAAWVDAVSAAMVGPYCYRGAFLRPVVRSDTALVLSMVVTASINVGKLFADLKMSTPGWPVSPSTVEIDRAETLPLEAEPEGVMREIAVEMVRTVGPDVAAALVHTVPYHSLSPDGDGLCYLRLYEPRCRWAMALQHGRWPWSEDLDLSWGLRVGSALWVQESREFVHLADFEVSDSHCIIVGPSLRLPMGRVGADKSVNLTVWWRDEVGVARLAPGYGQEVIAHCATISSLLGSIEARGWWAFATPGLRDQLLELRTDPASAHAQRVLMRVLQTVTEALAMMGLISMETTSDYVACSAPLCLMPVGQGYEAAETGYDSDDFLSDGRISVWSSSEGE